MRLGEETYSVDPMHPHFETMCGWCNGKLGGIEASLNTDLNPGDWCEPPPVSPARLMRVNC